MMTSREALLSPSYWRQVCLIEQSKTWTPSRIEAYQQVRLQELIRQYGGKITDKKDYRDDLNRSTRWDGPLLMRTIRTGGTSGEPLRFRANTVARQQKELAYMFDIWSAIGYSPFDLRVVYRGNAGDRICRFERLQNRWVISVSSGMPDRFELRQWARQLPPFFLHVYPSSLYTLIDLLQERAGHMRVRLVAEANVDRSKIQKFLEQRLSMVELDFEYVPHIERRPKGKRRYFVDESEKKERQRDAVSSLAP